MADKDYPGQEDVGTQSSDFATLQFIIDMAIARMSKAMLVQVKKATSKGEVAAPGQVDVLPMVKMQDSFGTVQPHGQVHNLPYYRLQAGTKGIILDPKVNDIGLAVYADRDISAVKKNRKESQPGSFRQHDMADGMFFPCFLGETLVCYIRFTDDYKIIISPDNGTTTVTFDAKKVLVNVAGRKISVTDARIDLNADPNAGTSKVMTEAGPCEHIWADPT